MRDLSDILQRLAAAVHDEQSFGGEGVDVQGFGSVQF